MQVSDRALRFDARTIALVSASLASFFLGSAHANELASFREFHKENPDWTRRQARRTFNQLRKTPELNRAIVPIETPASSGTEGAIAPSLHLSPDLRTILRRSKLERNGFQMQSSGRLVKTSRGIELDLQSGIENIVLGERLFREKPSVNIQTGNKSKTLRSGDSVTASEYLAVLQVLYGDEQTLVIDASGRSTGGDIDLGSIVDANSTLRATKFVVPENLTTYGDFDKRSSFRLRGDIVNYGTIQATSSNTIGSRGLIAADEIINHKGASIVSSLDLSLETTGGITNFGLISSEAELSLSSANVVNSGTIQSAGNLTLSAPEVTNRGEISSASSVNLNGVPDAALSIDNRSGKIAARDGAINLRNADFLGSFDTSLVGGDLLSREFNINTGHGLATVEVEKLTGAVNQKGHAAHVLTNTDKLIIGDIYLGDDPTFYNLGGSIHIAGNITVGEDLAIIASGDITTANGAIVTAGNGARGFDITLIAGADFTATGGANSDTLPPLTGAATEVVLSGKASKTGGSILAAPGSAFVAQSTDSSGDDDGGDIEMFAFAGKTAGSGRIALGDVAVVSAGKNDGDDGDVLLVAGSKGNKSNPIDVIITGEIDTLGDTGLEGKLTLATHQPTSTDKNPVVYNAAGQRTSSSRFSSGNAKLNKYGNVLFSDSSAATDIETQSIDALVGGTLVNKGTTFVDGLFQVYVGNGMNDSSSSTPLTATTIAISGGGDIGAAGSPMNFDVSSSFQVSTTGDSVYLTLTGPGTVFFVGDNRAREVFSVTAPSLTFNSTFNTSIDAFITSNTIELLSSEIILLPVMTAKEQVSISKVGVGSLESTTLQTISTPRLVLQSGGDIGSVTSFVLPTSVKEFEVVAGNNVDLTATGTKVISQGINSSSLELQGNSLTLLNGTTASVGDLSVSVDKLVVDGIVTGELSINLVALSNIKLAANSSVLTTAKTVGSGDVDIRVGSPGVAFLGEPENVVVQETGGTVSFFGSNSVLTKGLLKAKAPDNLITALGANVSLTNGTDKTTSLSIGGGVIVTADPPVPTGTPTILR